MPKPTMLKQPVVRKDQEHEDEDRGQKAPVLVGVRSGLVLLLGRLERAGRGYALAGAGVVVAAVVAVSLLSWLAPDSDRPIASPLEAVGRVAGEVIEQVDDQVEALLGTDGENIVVRSVRQGLALASSAIPSPGDLVGIAAGQFTSTASLDSASSSTDDAAAPSRGEESSWPSDETPSQSASSTPPPSGASETPTTSTDDAPSPPTASEPPASEEPPAAEEPPTPPPSAEPPPGAEEEPSSPPPAAEEPPTAEEPAPPSTEEPPPATEDPSPPIEGPPRTNADE